RADLGERGPFGDLAVDKLRELGGRAADQAEAERLRLRLHVGQRQNARDVGVDLGDDLLRRALGREQRVPGGFAELDALLLEGRASGARARERRGGGGASSRPEGGGACRRAWGSTARCGRRRDRWSPVRSRYRARAAAAARGYGRTARSTGASSCPRRASSS